MFTAIQNTPAQRVPAWKRLGLKLKGTAPSESPVPAAGTSSRGFNANHTASAHANDSATTADGTAANGTKRKLPPSTLREGDSTREAGSKRSRREDQFGSRGPAAVKKQKSVSFAEGTKDDRRGSVDQTDGREPAKKEAKKAKKKKAKKAKNTKVPAESTPEFSLEPALAYLRQWHTARASWKFNKNHQTLLIKNAFSADKIPSADIGVFYEYIRDLKGFVRTRLREAADEIKKKDMDQGASAFGADVNDRDAKQKQYEDVISRFLQQQRDARLAGSSKTGNGKRSFDEVEFVLRTADPDVQRRVLKRIRAELVLDELSDSETSSSVETTSTSASSSGGVTTERETDIEKRPSLHNGQQSMLKRQRRKKARINTGDSDESSSESDEDEDSDSDASSSSSDGSDGGIGLKIGQDGVETLSSSSSSSSSSAEPESAESDEGGESENEVRDNDEGVGKRGEDED